METLTQEELVKLVNAVFPRLPGDKSLAVLVDLPMTDGEDNHDWEIRREMALDWASMLADAKDKLGLERIELIAYKNVGANNAQLPENLYVIADRLPGHADELAQVATPIELQTLLTDFQLYLVPTEYSATAPLKLAARKHPIRAATMAGFSEKMIPALRLDYEEISRRVHFIEDKLNNAQSAQVTFIVDEQHTYEMFFDLRFRPGHASSGRFPLAGTAGNLPSGETYIVPYEGELEQDSKTQGILPVQFAEEVVYYTVEKNRAVAVTGEGSAREHEEALIKSEPAYANIAELGFGVLADFGVDAIGEVLLDEKLGFHIAFGRSDHFGGSVGPEHFSSPQAVVHIDRVYIPATQPRILVKKVALTFPEHKEDIIADGKYLIF